MFQKKRIIKGQKKSGKKYNMQGYKANLRK